MNILNPNILALILLPFIPGLKKVTDDMKTHKNPALKAPPGQKAAPVKKPPVFELQGKKWVVVSGVCIYLKCKAEMTYTVNSRRLKLADTSIANGKYYGQHHLGWKGGEISFRKKGKQIGSCLKKNLPRFLYLSMKIPYVVLFSLTLSYISLFFQISPIISLFSKFTSQ